MSAPGRDDRTAKQLRRLIEIGAALVPGADLVSVTLRAPNGEYHTPVETNPAALDLDRLQYEYGEGPCVEAARPDGPGFGGSPELATEPQWPRFGPSGYCVTPSTKSM